MTTRVKYASLSVFAIAFAMFTTGCSPIEAKLAPVLNSLISDKQLLESFVHDVKRTSSAGDPAYEELRGLYSEARAAQQALLTAVQMSGDLDEKTPLEPIVERVQQRAAAFVSRGVSVLSPGARSVVPEHLLTLPPELNTILLQLPRKYRRAAMAELREQVEWRPWDSI